MIYDEEYYKSNNYIGYSERADRYHKLAEDIDKVLTMFNIVDKYNTSILDYGCAFGFLSEGMTQLGYSVEGYDISDYALSVCNTRGTKTVSTLTDSYDLVLFMDVLEHMTNEELYVLFNIISPDIVIGRIPCADAGNTEFVLDISKTDPTHINCKDKSGWKKFLAKFGYNTIFTLNTSSIYDSVGVFSFIAFNNSYFKRG